jgi:hypothetical protein
VGHLKKITAMAFYQNAGVKMAGASISDRDAAKAIQHILSLSAVYFSAFRFPRNRLRMWRFLLLVLGLESKDEEKHIRGDFSELEIKSVLGDTVDSGNVGHWRRELVSHFRQPDGPPFLEEVTIDRIPLSRGRPRETKYFKFSPSFEQPAADYVERLLMHVMDLPPLATNFRRLTPARKTQLFKDLIAFQREHYYSPWGRFIESFPNLLPIDMDLKAVKSAFADRIPYWAITVLTWKHGLEGLQPPLRERNYKADVESALREVEQTDLQNALKSMINWKILVRDENGGHHLVSALDPPLRNYAAAISSAKKQFAAFLHSALN